MTKIKTPRLRTPQLNKSYVERELDPEERAPFRELIKDYDEAAKEHTGFQGGINAQVAATLIRLGWRKAENSN